MLAVPGAGARLTPSERSIPTRSARRSRNPLFVEVTRPVLGQAGSAVVDDGARGAVRQHLQRLQELDDRVPVVGPERLERELAWQRLSEVPPNNRLAHGRERAVVREPRFLVRDAP